MITGTNKVFEVNDSEYAYCCSAFKPVCSGKSIAMYIPKLMGAINSVGSESIVINGLFANDITCKPVFATKVTKSKAISPVLKENCNWLDKVNGSGTVPKGTMFTVEFLNGNIATPFLTTK